MTPTVRPALPRMKMGLPRPPAAAPVPVRDYTVQEIRRDGWTPGAVAYVHRVLDDCLERGIDVSLSPHFELHDLWEGSAACRAERKAGVVTPARRAFFASMKAEHLARRAEMAR